MLGYNAFDLFFCQGREDLDIFLCFGISHIQPELVELVRRSIACVKPDVAAFGLAEFAAVGLGNQRAGESKRLAAEGAAYEFGTGGDVAPLVAAAKAADGSSFLCRD